MRRLPACGVPRTPAMMIEVLADPAAVVERACEVIESAASRTVALAGGTTGEMLCRALGSRGSLSSVDVWMVDERCVPPDSRDSNARMIRQTLGESFHRILGEEAPEEAARIYEEELLARLGAEPVFDLVVLGMGADGHVASLFPDSPELAERRRAVVATRETHGGFRRVTLTLPVLNRARQKLFVESGPGKSVAFARIQSGDLLPAGRILGATWIVDRAAATSPSPATHRGASHDPIEGQEVLFEL
ncbi:MAG: 6-phosphogluconolactonase [Actinomycetota bacterium]